MDSFDISASALTAQRLRLDVIASNLANVNTTRGADGKVGAYHRRNVVFSPIMASSLNAAGGAQSGAPGMSGFTMNGPSQVSFKGGSLTLKAGVNRVVQEQGMGVKVSSIHEDDKTPDRLVYDPSHPDADKDGYVHMPNINPVTEMVDMIAASRAYEANVNAISSAKSMAQAALQI